MWPRKLGSSIPSTSSVGDDRGFTNWPAIRPSLTTGSIEPYVSTAAICRITFSFSRMLAAEKSWNDSAQSPACNRKARPAATSASDSRSRRASPANTSGGIEARRSRAASTAAGSGQSGWWSAGRSLQEAGDQVGWVVAMERSVYRHDYHPPPWRRRPGHGRRLLLRRRPARDLGALRAGGAAGEHAGHGRDPAGGGSRPG